MRIYWTMAVFALIAYSGTQSPSAPRPAPGPRADTRSEAIAAAAGAPILFAPNQGQAPGHYRFQSIGFGQTALFADSHAVLSRQSGTSFVVTWDGTVPSRPQARLRTDSRHSFLYGEEEAAWSRGLEGFAELRYPDRYHGIDLTFTGDGGRLKSTWYVQPGVDPGQIRWRYFADWMLEPRVSEDGDLVVVDHVGGTVVTERAPIAWQVFGSERRDVEVRYAVFGDGSVGFELGTYDEQVELIVDPDIEWATFLGGSGTDHINDMAVDAEGMVYLTGYVHSKYCDENFPVRAGDRTAPVQWWYGGEIGDAFVVKIDPHGRPMAAPCPQGTGPFPRIVYSTRLGGGRTYVCNTGLLCTDTTNPWNNCCPPWTSTPKTWDPNCSPSSAITSLRYGPMGPGVPGFQWHLSTLPMSYYPYPFPHPTLTCASGRPAATRPRGSDHGFGIAVDTNGEAVIVGRTESDDFPGTGSAVSPNPSMVPAQNPSWQPTLGSNYVGQCGPQGLEAHSDAFITRLNAAGTQLIFSTYFGGAEHEQAFAVDLDSGGNAYVAGYIEAQTSSSLVPTGWQGCPTPTAQGDGFILKFDPTGLFLGGRYLGGTDWDIAIDIDVGPNPDNPSEERVYVVGTTRSADFTQITCVDNSCNPVPLCTTSQLQGTYAGYNNPEHDYFFDTRTKNLYGDGWVARLSTDLVTCENFTYVDFCFQGSALCTTGLPTSDEWFEAIKVDDAGVCWVTGTVGLGLTPYTTACGTSFQGAVGMIGGFRLSCTQPNNVVAATLILGEDVVHPFDIDVDNNCVYIAGGVGRLKTFSNATGLATVSPLSGNWVYDHRDCNGNMSTRPFDLSQLQVDGTCSYACATYDGFFGVFSKAVAMQPVLLSYLGGEGVEALHAIEKVGPGFVVGGFAGKSCSMAPRKNWLCEKLLFNANEIDVPYAPGHCNLGGLGYGPTSDPNRFRNIYQGSRYTLPGSAEAYLAYILP